jgi:hypothetical protein
MLRVLEPLCGMAQAIIDPHLLQRRSARKSASRLSLFAPEEKKYETKPTAVQAVISGLTFAILSPTLTVVNESPSKSFLSGRLSHCRGLSGP